MILTICVNNHNQHDLIVNEKLAQGWSIITPLEVFQCADSTFLFITELQKSN